MSDRKNSKTPTRLEIPIETLTKELDELFSLAKWEPDPAMSRWVPRVYESINYDYTQVFENAFCEKFNGLMLKSSDTISEIYSASFPEDEIIQYLVSKATGNALLFLHHPIDMEVSGVGFLAIDPRNLMLMKNKGISVYSCHAPLDCHDQIGTTASISRAFRVRIESSFARYGNGFAGRVGFIRPTSLQKLIGEGQKYFGVSHVEVGGKSIDVIKKVAIVAGGGDDIELFREAEELGAEVYITGEWYTRTQPRDEDGKRWAKANRLECLNYAARSSMAFLGFSHAATEYLVMRREIKSYFRKKGVFVRCIPQADWWK